MRKELVPLIHDDMLLVPGIDFESSLGLFQVYQIRFPLPVHDQLDRVVTVFDNPAYIRYCLLPRKLSARAREDD